MKRNFQILLFVAFCLVAIPAVSAQSRVTGVFGGFTANKQSGDLDGMRIMIFNAGNEYHAIVQIAGGGAEDPTPVFVPVTVKGRTISFTVESGKYTGTVSAAGLRIKQEGERGASELLRRKPCTTYF